MIATPLVYLAIVLVGALAQGQFSDYDYQDSFESRSRFQQQEVSTRPLARKQAFNNVERSNSPHPVVAILKQINMHNDDGSYTYGYEAADGSFKIETKKVTGEVSGKYGYVDSNGKLRTVEYGANKFGFQPSGEGITVPPPTLVDETLRRGPNGEIIEYDEEEETPQAPLRSTSNRLYQTQHNQARKISRPQQQRAPSSQPLFSPEDSSFQFAPQPQFRPRQESTLRGTQPERQPVNIASYVAPSTRSHQSTGPVPQRATIPGAVFAPSTGPVPPRARIPGAVPAPAAAAPVYEHSAQSFSPAPRKIPPKLAQRSGTLDALVEKYALPADSARRSLSDFSFGSDGSSYSGSINF